MPLFQERVLAARPVQLRQALARSRAVPAAMAAAWAVGAIWLYVAGARAHAREMNVEKSRGDQTAYIGYALDVYANRHGRNPPITYRRNRMPLYPFIQSFVYDPAMSHWDFFYAGRKFNIWLSLACLALLAAVFWRLLPALVAAELTLILMFGCFIYKAGYFQPELLFYTIFFCTFLVTCQWLAARSPERLLVLGGSAGVLAALAHLTKAALLPFVAIALAMGLGRALGPLVHPTGLRATSGRLLAWRLVAVLALAACFLGTLWPYLFTSKRVFGQYFYNVNTTYYAWYDGWDDVIRGTRAHDNEVQRPRLPRRELPGPAKYLREHTAGEIASRIGGGLADMWRVSWRGYGYLKYVLLYTAFALVLVLTRGRAVAAVLRRHPLHVAFVATYAGVYLLLTAFYHPISNTGTARFLLIHLAPLMFTAAWVFTRRPIRRARWQAGQVVLTADHFHIFVLGTLILDITLDTWPRLMTVYGGF